MYYGERCTFVYIVKNIDFKDVKIAKLKLHGQNIPIHVHQFLTTTSCIGQNFQHEL